MSGKEINELIQTGELAKADLPAEAVKEAEVSEELLEAAEAHANKQIADIKEENRKRKRNLIKLGAMTLLSVIIFIFTTIAWFSMNREVSTGSMAVKAGGSPFELEVFGANVENSSDFSKADNDYKNGEAQLTANTYRTSGQYDKIIWRKTGTTADDGHYSDGLSPNSHGKLTFWVVPNSTGTLDIEFIFKVRGFIGTYTPATTEGAEPTLNDLFEVTDNMEVTAENELKDAADLAKKKAALEYIQGHILFFSDYDGINYSGFLGTGRSIRFGDCINPTAEPKAKYNPGNAVSVTEGNKYQVTIYWKWANTLEQMIFDSDSEYRDNPLFSASNNTDRNAIYTYLKDTTNNTVFSEASNIESLLTTIQSGTNINTALTTLTNAYDNADQIIGNNLDYILIEMSAGTPS